MELETQFEFVTSQGQTIDVLARADVNEHQRLTNISLQFIDPLEDKPIDISFDRDQFDEIEELALLNLMGETTDMIPVDDFMIRRYNDFIPEH
jgi:hypothetical protein